VEIISGIHQVDGVNANCFIVVRESLTIIDTGLPGNGGKILDYITGELGRSPSEIRSIILTHAHIDHIGSVAKIKKAAPAAKVAGHSEETGQGSGKRPIPPPEGITGRLLRIVNAIIRRVFLKPDTLLEDGDRIDGLVCIHLPGHTSGSLGLLDEATRTLFAGDILRYDGTTLTEGPANATLDIDQEQESVRRIAGLDFDVLLIGHGLPLRARAGETVRMFAETLPR